MRRTESPLPTRGGRGWNSPSRRRHALLVALRAVAAGNLPGQGVVDACAGRVYIPGSSGNSSDTVVTTLDARTGRTVGAAYLGPTGSGTAMMPGAAGTLAVDPARGRVYGVAFGPVDANGRAVGTGTLHVLDARTGAVLRSTAVGVNPLAVAVDAATGCVVVVDAGGTGGAAAASDPWSLLRRALPRWLPLPAPRGEVLVPGDVRVLDAP